MLVATQGPEAGRDRLKAAALKPAPHPAEVAMDPLAPARGILLGSALGACIWLALAGATWFLAN